MVSQTTSQGSVIMSNSSTEIKSGIECGGKKRARAFEKLARHIESLPLFDVTTHVDYGHDCDKVNTFSSVDKNIAHGIILTGKKADDVDFTALRKVEDKYNLTGHGEYTGVYYTYCLRP